MVGDVDLFHHSMTSFALLLSRAGREEEGSEGVTSSEDSGDDPAEGPRRVMGGAIWGEGGLAGGKLRGAGGQDLEREAGLAAGVGEKRVNATFNTEGGVRSLTRLLQ